MDFYYGGDSIGGDAMKIGFCGASSTGKSSLIDHLFRCPPFAMTCCERVTIDARAIIRKAGFDSIDQMNSRDLQDFQQDYFKRKIELESTRASFCCDRSFVDIAAFWLERDAINETEDRRAGLANSCRAHALQYDIHVFCPFGVIPFEDDGYRSLDLASHERVSNRIRTLLADWGLTWIELESQDIARRAKQVLDAIERHST
jgi:nicotinamide riboside kinase